MNSSIARSCLLGLFALVTVVPSWAQQPGSTPSPSQPGASNPGSPGNKPGTQSPSMNQSKSPLYVNGRVLLENGQPAAESVTLELNCGMRPLQVIHTDLGGYFTFSVGAGVQSNMDFSASNGSPSSMNNSLSNLGSGIGGSLTGCEVRAAVPGFHPINYTLADRGDLGRIEVGTLRLKRIEGAEGSSISVTSLLVPKNARKEFEKAQKELQKNKLDQAKQHLEKAVAEYDKYAAAWNALGQIYFSGKDTEKARHALENAIAADAQYIPPYMNLASLNMQDKQYESAIEMAGKALALDPSIGYANFLQALGNLNLNRLDEAEKSARATEKAPHTNTPQVHAILVDIYLRKQDYTNAATHMRAYLKEAPQGQFADEIKKNLDQLEKSTESAASNSAAAAE